MCSFLVWKNACLNYREFGLEDDLVGVPNAWNLSAQSFIRLLQLVWREYDIVAMNEWKKKCVGLQRTWVSKRTVGTYQWLRFGYVYCVNWCSTCAEEDQGNAHYPRRNLWALKSNQRVTFKAHLSQRRTAFVISEKFTSLCVNNTSRALQLQNMCWWIWKVNKTKMLTPQFFHVGETID